MYDRKWTNPRLAGLGVILIVGVAFKIAATLVFGMRFDLVQLMLAGSFGWIGVFLWVLGRGPRLAKPARSPRVCPSDNNCDCPPVPRVG
jgi:hypothetical protein